MRLYGFLSFAAARSSVMQCSRVSCGKRLAAAKQTKNLEATKSSSIIKVGLMMQTSRQIEPSEKKSKPNFSLSVDLLSIFSCIHNHPNKISFELITRQVTFSLVAAQKLSTIIS